MARIWGLTGSIGMGKSAVAAMLQRQGIAVFDADAEVHKLQGPGVLCCHRLKRAFPEPPGQMAWTGGKLGAAVFAHPQERKALEAIVHPAVQHARTLFLQRHRARRVVVLDIPLLFETHAHRWLAGVIVVSAPAWKQRARVLARPGMTAQKFARIRRLQTPDAEKRRRADILIDTGGSFDRTRKQVRRLVACLHAKAGR